MPNNIDERVIAIVQDQVWYMPIGEIIQLSPDFDMVYVHRLTKNAYKVGSRIYRSRIADAGATYHTRQATMDVIRHIYTQIKMGGENCD